jgi:hypothetical protein
MTDVAIVIGANDVVNPAAKEDPQSPLYGMPIINVDEARTCIVLKRSMRRASPGWRIRCFQGKHPYAVRRRQAERERAGGGIQGIAGARPPERGFSMDEAGWTLLLDAALEAGRAILDVYRSPEFGVEWKEDRSPLTRADRAAHEIILARLAGTGLPVLSEESRALPIAERQRWPRYWLVDPLDGTKEFIRRNGEFTVNIALIEGTAPGGRGGVCAGAGPDPLG